MDKRSGGGISLCGTLAYQFGDSQDCIGYLFGRWNCLHLKGVDPVHHIIESFIEIQNTLVDE